MAHKITVELDWDDITILSNTMYAVDWHDMRWVVSCTEDIAFRDGDDLPRAWHITHEVEGDGPLYATTGRSLLTLGDLLKAANKLASSPGRYRCKCGAGSGDIAALIVGDVPYPCNCTPQFIIEYALTGEIQ